MPLHKVTDFLSEISAFFRKNDAHKAMYSILDVIKWLRMNESTLFGMKSKCNNVYPLLQVFQALLLYPCFMVRNPYRFTGSSLSGLLGCKKDVFYRFMSNPKINWRKSVYHLTLQLWSKMPKGGLWKSCSRKRRGCWGWANARPATSPRKSRRHP